MRRPSATRSELERRIGDLAEIYGWLHHHARCTGRTREGYADGFPVDVVLRDGRLVFFTIAGAGGLPTPEAAWAEALSTVESVEMHVIRGRDHGALAEVLTPPQPQPAADTRAPEPRAPPGSSYAPQHDDVRPEPRGRRRKPDQAPRNRRSREKD